MLKKILIISFGLGLVMGVAYFFLFSEFFEDKDLFPSSQITPSAQEKSIDQYYQEECQGLAELWERDLCLSNLAEVKADPQLCALVADPGAALVCRDRVSFRQAGDSFSLRPCTQISDDGNQIACIAHVIASGRIDTAGCQDLPDDMRLFCQNELQFRDVIAGQDPGACQGLVSEDYIEECQSYFATREVIN